MSQGGSSAGSDEPDRGDSALASRSVRFDLGANEHAVRAHHQLSHPMAFPTGRLWAGLMQRVHGADLLPNVAARHSCWERR